MIRTLALALLTVALTISTLSRDGVYVPDQERPALSERARPLSEGASVQELRCTPEHPFWVQGKGFVAAEDLRVGDRGLDAEGNEVLITGVEIKEERAQHYNFEAEDFHTYFVCETPEDPGIWVHNLCKRLRGRAAKIKAAAERPGNSGVGGSVDQADANRLGRDFVGEGHTRIELPNGQTALLSADGKRLYRAPKAVKNEYSATGRQANFQQRRSTNSSWRDEANVSNVHLDVR